MMTASFKVKVFQKFHCNFILDYLSTCIYFGILDHETGDQVQENKVPVWEELFTQEEWKLEKGKDDEDDEDDDSTWVCIGNSNSPGEEGKKEDSLTHFTDEGIVSPPTTITEVVENLKRKFGNGKHMHEEM